MPNSSPPVSINTIYSAETIVPSLFTILLLIIFACCVYGCCIWEGRSKKEKHHLQKTEHHSNSATVLSTSARSTDSYLLKTNSRTQLLTYSTGSSTPASQQDIEANGGKTSKSSQSADNINDNHAGWTMKGSLTQQSLISGNIV